MSSIISRFPVLAAAFFVPIATGCGTQDARVTARQAETAADTPVSVATEESGTLTPSGEAPATPPAPTNVSYADAEAAFHNGRYAEATELFASYTGTYPDNVWGHYMYGLAAWKSGDHELALDRFDEALRLDPSHRKSLLNAGRVLLETGQARDALGRIERALAIEPLSSEALRLLGRARHELGQVPQAIEAYQRALAIDERDVWAMNNLGLIYIQQDQGDEALRPLARAVELRGNAPVFRNNLGMALELSGYPVAARRAYASAVASDSTYARASANLTRLGGPVENQAADSAEAVDLAALAGEFQAEIERWRNPTGSNSVTVGSVVGDSVAGDSVAGDSVPGDPAVRDSAALSPEAPEGMARDTVQE